MSLDFKGREVSQKLGGWIENSAKFKSFLIDYQDIKVQDQLNVISGDV